MSKSDEKELWPGEDFSILAMALHGTTSGWASATAVKLGVNKKTLMGWVTDGAPLSVRDELRRMSGVDDESKIAFPRDEWIVGDSESDPDQADGMSREYIIHTRSPRFIARIVATVDEGHPIPSEEPADILSGVVYAADDGDLFCEIQWIDARPQGDKLVALFQEASNVLVLCSKSDADDTGMPVH